MATGMLVNFGSVSIPVAITDLLYFDNGRLHKVRVKFPDGSIPQHGWISVADENGKWRVGSSGKSIIWNGTESADQLDLERAAGKACATCSFDGVPTENDDPCWECGREPQ